jgi:hypothetical protein
MLRFLGDTGRVNDRKLRLFAVACCRHIWDRITEKSSRQAVEVSERYADDRASFGELKTAFVAADRASTAPSSPWGGLGGWQALDAARLAAHPEIRVSCGWDRHRRSYGGSGGQGGRRRFLDQIRQ